MNRPLLINRMDLQDDSNEKHKIFFTIVDINTTEISDKLLNVLHNSNFIDMNDIVFKYNGIELNITIQQVPAIIKMLCNENISIYEVYQPYTP